MHVHSMKVLNFDLDPFSEEDELRLKVNSIVKDLKEYQLSVVVGRNFSNLPKWLEAMGIKIPEGAKNILCAYLTNPLKVYRYVVSLILDNATTI